MITAEELARFVGKSTPELKAESKSPAFDMDGFLSKLNIEVIQRKPWQSHPAGMVF